MRRRNSFTKSGSPEHRQMMAGLTAQRMRPDYKNPDRDLADLLRKMEVICVFKLQSLLSTSRGRDHQVRGDLNQIGLSEFGLTLSQVKYCKGRAGNFVDSMRELARARNKADLKRYGSHGCPSQIRIVAGEARTPFQPQPIDAGWNVQGDGTWQIIDLTNSVSKAA